MTASARLFDVPGGNSTNLVVATDLPGTYLYHVIVTNSFGATTSAPVQLIVNPASAPIVTTDTTPSAATRYLGQSVTFSAAFEGTPPISYQWLNFAQPIPGATNTTLTLTNVQLSDAQPYSLQAANSLGTTTSTAAELTVLTPPAPGSRYLRPRRADQQPDRLLAFERPGRHPIHLRLRRKSQRE